MCRFSIRAALEADGDIEVTKEVDSGLGALEALRSEQYDVVTLDIDLPDLHGLSLLRELRERFPHLPVLIVSALSSDGASLALEALALGAADVVDKRLFASQASAVADKVRAVAPGPLTGTFAPVSPRKSGPSPRRSINLARDVELCVIGSSTGGPAVLQRILPCLPARIPFPVVIAQHMPRNATPSFAQRLSSSCVIPVSEARQLERLLPGRAYVLPGGLRSHIRPGKVVQTEPGQGHHAPCIDDVFNSAARVARERCLAILLTGMGRDGALGMRAVHHAGGMTIAQEESSCTVYGMPRAAIELGGVQRTMTPEQLRSFFESDAPLSDEGTASKR
jgi:two-component system chemotaxis response regulator CheB